MIYQIDFGGKDKSAEKESEKLKIIVTMWDFHYQWAIHEWNATLSYDPYN